jgi:hypothetical protein
MNKSLFDIYTDYLICSFGLTTATGLARLLDGEISHDQVTRLLSSPAKTGADLWRVVKPLVRQVESEDGVLIFDDSIEERPHTDENASVCWHWDQAKERNVKGINFITAFYSSFQVLATLIANGGSPRRSEMVLRRKPKRRRAAALHRLRPLNPCRSHAQAIRYIKLGRSDWGVAFDLVTKTAAVH